MPDEYISSIPDDTTEEVIGRYPTGEKQRSDYSINGEIVGRRFFFQTGELEAEFSFKDSHMHGRWYTWYAPNVMSSVETFINGKSHGIAKQWDDKGELVGTYNMEYGTGIDFWWQWRWNEDGTPHPYLAEVHYMRDGKPRGSDWWLNPDQKSVNAERYFYEGQYHGIERSWNLKGRLSRGYPKYYVYGKKVNKRQYVKATESDSTLPKFSIDDNEPYREFPEEVKANFR